MPLPLDSATVKPPVGANPLRVTLQEEDPGALTLAGMQDKPFNAMGGRTGLIVIVPPDPAVGTLFPPGFAAIVPLTPTGILPVAVLAVEKLAVATSPLPIAVVLSPKRIHIVYPLPLEQETLFPAEDAADPNENVTLVTLDGYDTVHCNPET